MKLIFLHPKLLKLGAKKGPRCLNAKCKYHNKPDKLLRAEDVPGEQYVCQECGKGIWIAGRM